MRVVGEGAVGVDGCWVLAVCCLKVDEVWRSSDEVLIHFRGRVKVRVGGWEGPARLDEVRCSEVLENLLASNPLPRKLKLCLFSSNPS